MDSFIKIIMDDVLSVPGNPSQPSPAKYTHDTFPFVEIGNFSGFFPEENNPALQHDWLFSVHGDVHTAHYLSEDAAYNAATQKALLTLSVNDSQTERA